MGVCEICRKDSVFISSFLGLCRDCILKGKGSLNLVREAHKRAREKFGLTPEIPRDKRGLLCTGCGNQCEMAVNRKGYCGLVENREGRLIRHAGTPEKGLCSFYYDPHPTNCVAMPFCPEKNHYGYCNLAVFYGACNFDCLFCQNWEFKHMTRELKPLISARDLADKVSRNTACVCYFGGNPDPQISHMIGASKIMVESEKNKLRICMESNGNSNWNLLRKFAEISFKSGGCIKFDLKAFDEKLNMALTGVSNKHTLRNFEKLVKFHKERKNMPFLMASTLLVPGYITEEEIGKISNFIAGLDRTIPYVLLGFYPTFLMGDLPVTSRKLADECFKTAKESGLERVRIGNIHLLG